jgi:hypothetical protein
VLFYDTTSATTGTGGGLALGGHSNGTTGAIYHFGNIQGIKENSTAGNYASAMLFSTRTNGATPVERMRIGSTGAVTITNSLNINYGNVVLTSGYGIDFGATANSSGSMSSELLDDYEEGTFTPTLSASTSAPSTAVTGVGTYTKVGRVCTIGIHFVNKNTTGASGNLKVTGLPFTSGDSSAFGSYIAYALANYHADAVSTAAWVASGQTKIEFYNHSDAGIWRATEIVAGNTKYLYLSLTYQTT